MAALNINNMRSQLRFGGARNTLFQITINNPVSGKADQKLPFMAQASSLPGWTLGNIAVPFMGRKINVPGDREFRPWSIEVINDEDFALRDAFETWNNKIQTVEGNIRDLPSAESIHYTTDAIITQLSKNGVALRSYEFKNLWPMEIGEIQMGWSQVDTIEVFPVTFMYDSYKVRGVTGNAGGV